MWNRVVKLLVLLIRWRWPLRRACRHAPSDASLRLPSDKVRLHHRLLRDGHWLSNRRRLLLLQLLLLLELLLLLLPSSYLRRRSGRSDILRLLLNDSGWHLHAIIRAPAHHIPRRLNRGRRDRVKRLLRLLLLLQPRRRRRLKGHRRIDRCRQWQSRPLRCHSRSLVPSNR